MIVMEHIKSIYFKDNKSYLRALVLREHEYYIYKFQKYLRGEEAAKTIFFKVYYRIKTNILGRKLGLTIPPDVFAEGLHIWHYGNIVVNRGARVGKNCVLHGDNCIGNNGNDNGCPIIGDNVDIGVGAKIIGNVHIANNVKIGAGAVVIKSCEELGVVLVGVPAYIKKGNNNE